MINAAIIDEVGVVQNVVVLNSLDEYLGSVECPQWVGIGMHIDTPEPEPEPEVAIPEPVIEPELTALERLQAFLQANPDVAALIQ